MAALVALTHKRLWSRPWHTMLWRHTGGCPPAQYPAQQWEFTMALRSVLAKFWLVRLKQWTQYLWQSTFAMTWDAKKGAFMMHLIMAEDKCQALHFGRITERFMQDKISHEVLSSRELYSTGKKGVTWEKGGKVTSHDHRSRGKPIYKSRNKYREDQCSAIKPKRGYTVSTT